MSPRLTVRAAGEEVSVDFNPALFLPERGPVSCATPADLPADVNALVPVGYTFKTWSGRFTYLQEELATLGPTVILWLPERPEPYLWDVRQGFTNNDYASGPARFYALSRVTNGGIVHAGPGAVTALGPGTHSSFVRSTSGPNQNKVVEAYNANGYIVANGTATGRDLGSGVQYDHVKFMRNKGRVARMLFLAANRGFQASPPGETAAVNGYQSNDIIIARSIFDGRDATGTPVATSPIMLNNLANPVVDKCTHLFTNKGMPTAYMCSNVKIFDSITDSVADSGWNFERCQDVLLERPVFLRRRSGSGDIAVNGDGESCRTTVIDPGFDAPFTISIWGDYGTYPSNHPDAALRGKPIPNTQKLSDIKVLQGGAPVTPIRRV